MVQVLNQIGLVCEVVSPDIHHRYAMGDSLHNRAIAWLGDNQIGGDEEIVEGEWD